MKKIGISQRVELIRSYGERRDCLDQRWSSLLLSLDCVPIPLLNIEPREVPRVLDELHLDAVILSGGNSIAVLDETASDAAPERDAFEAELLDQVFARGIPILGVCRGMQMINHHLGGNLSVCAGHVATRHNLTVVPEYRSLIASPVNSYHGYGILPSDLAPSLTPIAHDDDGHVEAFVHSQKQLMGIMWHPERETPLRTEDFSLIQKALGI
jgi:N5-(cytidine 5'-diphosphoramidyl)-L-glutamine hydrolase